jgi:hypothetical protein
LQVISRVSRIGAAFVTIMCFGHVPDPGAKCAVVNVNNKSAE